MGFGVVKVALNGGAKTRYKKCGGLCGRKCEGYCKKGKKGKK